MKFKNISRNRRLMLILLIVILLFPILFYINSPQLTLVSVLFVSLATLLFMGCCIVIPPILTLGIVRKRKKRKSDLDNQDAYFQNKNKKAETNYE